MKLRPIVKTSASYGLYYTCATSLYKKLPRVKRKPLVLGLHRVVEDFDASAKIHMPSMLISTRRLEKYLNWIARSRKFVSLQEAVNGSIQENVPDGLLATLTFDDGYRDIYYNAFPLLKRMSIPFAVFVNSDLVGTERLQIHDELFLLLKRAMEKWSSRRHEHIVSFLGKLDIAPPPGLGTNDVLSLTRILLHALPQRDVMQVIEELRNSVGHVEKDAPDLRSLTWEMIKEMHDAGVTIGSHTCSHALLTNESPERILEELNGSRQELEGRLGAAVTHFAYPDGQFNKRVVKAVAHAGYQAAYTICDHQDQVYPALTIPRRFLWQNVCVDAFGRPSRAVLECLVSGMLDGLRKCEAEHDL